MIDPDDKLLQRYRSLPAEEPPRALDDAILAASRRAVSSRPSFSRRWAAPASIAAVLVLAFGVTLEMQREQPGIEYQEPARSETLAVPAPPPLAAPQAPAEPVPAKKAAPELRRAPAPAMKEQVTKQAPRSASEPQAFPERAPPASMDSLRDANVAPAPAPAAAAAPAARAMAAPRAKAEALDADADPERELERIARLRDQGRNDEADKALEEFRRRHPEFRISDATWSRVKPR